MPENAIHFAPACHAVAANGEGGSPAAARPKGPEKYEVPLSRPRIFAGIYNTEFWIDHERRIGGVQMMQVLPFYDDGAIRTLREFDEIVYQSLR